MDRKSTSQRVSEGACGMWKVRLNARGEMHELAIAQNIVKISLEEAGKVGTEQEIESVFFRAGRLNAVIPDILIFNFDVLKVEEPQMEQAQLHVAQDPICVKCKACGHEAELEEPVFICLECGSPVAVKSGQEMYVERIIMKGNSDGN